MDERDEDIHIDLAPVLMDLSVSKLVRLANLAMNRLTMRDWGEIFGAIDVRANVDFVTNLPPCTCHPDDRPPGRCRRKYAASECQADASRTSAERGNGRDGE